MPCLNTKEKLAELIFNMHLSDSQLAEIVDVIKKTWKDYITIESRLDCYKKIESFKGSIKSLY